MTYVCGFVLGTLTNTRVVWEEIEGVVITSQFYSAYAIYEKETGKIVKNFLRDFEVVPETLKASIEAYFKANPMPISADPIRDTDDYRRGNWRV